MSYNFPSSPAVNDIYTPPGGSAYKWNGYGWAQLAAEGGADASGSSVTSSGTPAETKTLAGWMEEVNNAPQSFSGNSIQALRLTQDVDHRIEIIKDDAGPLNWEGTRAGIVYQHRDTLPLAQQVSAHSVVFQNVYTGDGYVTAAADSSESIWTGVHSTFKKSGDGSGHAFTATGELLAYGSGAYNEGGLFQGIMSNIGSTHGTIGGVEMQVKDGSAGVNFDTKMNSIIGRMARFNNGSRLCAPFMASSEGTYGPDAVFIINPTGSQPFKNGIDMRDGTFSGFPFISTGFSVNSAGDTIGRTFLSPGGLISSGSASGLSGDPGYVITAHGQVWSIQGQISGGSLYFHNNTAGTFPFSFGTTGVMTATGAAVLLSGTAPAAGGVLGLRMSSTSGFGMYVGSGAPTAGAAKGSLYLRSDGTAGNRTYVNTDGSGTWTPLLSESAGGEPPITLGTTAQYWRGDKSWQTLDKAAVGLANVDNTSDANKPVSTAQATADALAVLKAGDTMTGQLKLPTTTTVLAPINMVAGTAVSSPVDGDLWVSSGQLFYRSGGTTTTIINNATAQQMTGAKSFTAAAKFMNTLATPAGGVTGSGITFGTSTNLGIFFGSGAPTLSAAKGSHYLRSDGASGSYTYVNTDGATAWAPLTNDAVLKAGDTMTGTLTVSSGSAVVGASSGLGSDPGYNIIAHAQTWGVKASTGSGSLYLHNITGATFPFTFGTTGVLTMTGGLIALSGTAPTAGGVVALRMSSTASFGIFVGSGVPSISAAQGSIYMRTDGAGTNTRVYVNTNGTTGWAAMSVIATGTTAPSSPATNDVWIDTT